MPTISKMQIDLMVNSFANDFARVATLQYTNSVGQARMTVAGRQRGAPWAVARTGRRTRGPGETDARSTAGSASSWPTWPNGWPTPPNRAAQGIAAGQHADRLDERTGQGQHAHASQYSLRAGRRRPRFQDGPGAEVPGSRAQPPALSLAHAIGHPIERFGNPDYCGDGPLTGLS